MNFRYYVAQAINDSYASPVIAFAFASDVINKQYTSIIYGFIIGVYMLGFLLSSIIVATNIVESSLHAAFISSCMVLVSILLVIVVPESTTHEQREKVYYLIFRRNFLYLFFKGKNAGQGDKRK